MTPESLGGSGMYRTVPHFDNEQDRKAAVNAAGASSTFALSSALKDIGHPFHGYAQPSFSIATPGAIQSASSQYGSVRQQSHARGIPGLIFRGVTASSGRQKLADQINSFPIDSRENINGMTRMAAEAARNFKLKDPLVRAAVNSKVAESERFLGLQPLSTSRPPLQSRFSFDRAKSLPQLSEQEQVDEMKLGTRIIKTLDENDDRFMNRSEIQAAGNQAATLLQTAAATIQPLHPEVKSAANELLQAAQAALSRPDGQLRSPTPTSFSSNSSQLSTAEQKSELPSYKEATSEV